MLQDFDKTLENLLIREGKINKNEIDISFDTPNGEWSASLNRPTINLWAFDLRENVKLRNMQMTTRAANGRGFREFPERRMNLTYLVTAWARKIEDEHQLIWRALAVLKRFAKLEPSTTEGMVRYQTREIPLMVADMTEAEVNITDLWSVLDNQMKLGFLVTATLELDLTLSLEAPLVLEGRFTVGQSENPETKKLDAPDPEFKITAKEPEGEGDKKED